MAPLIASLVLLVLPAAVSTQEEAAATPPLYKGWGVVANSAWRGEPADVLALAVNLVPQEGAKSLLVVKDGVAKIRYASAVLVDAKGRRYPMWAKQQPVEAAGGEPFRSTMLTAPGELQGTFYFVVPADADVDTMVLRLGTVKVPLKGIEQHQMK